MGKNNYPPENINFFPQIFNVEWDQVILENSATNNFINGLGIVFHHFIAIPNPIGEHNMGDLRRTFGEEDQNQFDASINSQFQYIENGFLYKSVGQVWGIFQ